MKRLYLVILFGIVSCARDNTITLSDLKFPDIEREYINKNKIDTLFIFYTQEDGSEVRFYKAYDEAGRVLFDSTQIAVSIRYNYDSIGFLIRQETRMGRHGIWIDSLSYRFDRDSLILTQKWINSDIECRFLFDEKGRVRQSVKLDHPEGGRLRREKTDYIYKGDLVRKSLHYLDNKLNPDIENSFYYSRKGILDSISLKTDYGHRQRTVFDSLGLPVAEDNERFVYKTRM